MGESLTAVKYPGRLLKDLRDLFLQNELVDTTLTLAECGTMFYAHRCVLVAASPFFKNLLKNEQLDQDITIKTINAESFEKLLDFLYSGTLKVNKDSVWQVLAAANQLQVPEVASLCQQFISSLSGGDSDQSKPVEDEDDESLIPSLDTVKLEPLEDSQRLSQLALPRRGRPSRMKTTPKIKDKLMTTGTEDSDVFKPPQVPAEMRQKLQKLLKSKKKIKGKSKRGRGRPKKRSINDLQLDDDFDNDEEIDEDFKPIQAVRRKRGRPRKSGASPKDSESPRKRIKRERLAKSSPSKTRRGESDLLTDWQDDSITIKDLPRVSCPLCVYRFYHQSALQLHLRRHFTPKNTLAINYRKAMKTLRICKLVKSYPSHNGKAIYECIKCSVTFQQRNRCLAHIRKIHYKKTNRKRLRLLHCSPQVITRNVRRCEYCLKTFKHTTNLDRHKMLQHKEDEVVNPQFTCRHCHHCFTHQQNFIVHLTGHGLNDKEVDLEFKDPEKVALRVNMKNVPRDDSNPLPYQCPNCVHRYETVKDLNVHMINKHHKKILPTYKSNVKKIRCEEDDGKCDKVFSRMQDLRKHLQTDHQEASYDCYLCKYSTSVKKLLRLHLKYKHTSLEDRTCNECGKHFRKRYHYKIHMVSKHDHVDPEVKVFKCEVEGCSYKTYARYVLDIHMKKHEKGKNFSCNICGRKLKSEKSVEKHVRKVHMGIRPFICDICGASYGEEHELKMHIVRHSDVKQYQCEHCDYATHDKGNFQSHQYNMHKIPNPARRTLFTCEICGFTVVHRTRFNEHMNTHTKAKPFKCPHCDDHFGGRSTLRDHIKWKHSEARIKCDYCTFVAPTKFHVKTHMRIMHTHRNLRPYKCVYCDYRCNLSGNCRKHIAQKHKGMEIKWVKVADVNDENRQESVENVNRTHQKPATLSKRKPQQQPQQPPQQQQQHSTASSPLSYTDNTHHPMPTTSNTAVHHHNFVPPKPEPSHSPEMPQNLSQHQHAVSHIAHHHHGHHPHHGHHHQPLPGVIHDYSYTGGEHGTSLYDQIDQHGGGAGGTGGLLMPSGHHNPEHSGLQRFPLPLDGSIVTSQALSYIEAGLGFTLYPPVTSTSTMSNYGGGHFSL